MDGVTQKVSAQRETLPSQSNDCAGAESCQCYCTSGYDQDEPSGK